MPISESWPSTSSICSEVELLGGQDSFNLVIGDVAALLRELDHPLDGGIGQVEQRAVGFCCSGAASVSSRSVAFVAMSLPL